MVVVRTGKVNGMNRKLLSEMEIGEKAYIDYIEPIYLKRRLQDLGMIHGNKITCMLCTPLKTPIAYQIQNTVIAIRSEDAAKVHIYE